VHKLLAKRVKMPPNIPFRCRLLSWSGTALAGGQNGLVQRLRQGAEVAFCTKDKRNATQGCCPNFNGWYNNNFLNVLLLSAF
jgi:hypothetical protein